MLGNRPLQDGDEEIELWIEEGDCYTMDRGVQIGYEHQVPKVPSYGSRREAHTERRAAPLQGRGRGHGYAERVPRTTGTVGLRKNGGRFGRLRRSPKAKVSIIAGSTCVRRAGTTRRNAGSVGRSSKVPSPSWCRGVLRRCARLTVSRGCGTRRRESSGAAALWRNLVSNSQPIRVFRSSKLANAWAPPLLNGKKEPAQYRYDGLYDIACMWDDAGNRSTKEPRAAPPGSGKGKKRKAPPSMPRTVATRGVRPDSLQTLPPPATPAVVPAPPVSPQAPPSTPAAVRPDSLQALPPPPPPAETLSDDVMDCDGRGPAPTAGTDFVVPPVRQSYKQPIDAAGARATTAA